MIEISRGKVSEFEEVIDFLDYVFSKNSSSHDFPLMYPNLYRRTETCMDALINLREDGVIKASILAYPRTLSICGTELKVFGIGSVATHPRARGRGFMSMLMNYNLEEMKKSGAALSNLGGRRSRYNHFGYEIGGISYRTDLSYDAVRDACRDDDGSAFTFRAFEAAETELIDALHAIYAQKRVHYVYDRDDFALRFYSWSGFTPYAVYSASGELLGYLAMTGARDGRSDVREIVLKDDADSERVVFSYILQTRQRVSLRLGEWQLRHFGGLLRISGGLSAASDAMWNVLDWPAAFRTLLALKATYATLEEGTLVLDIAGSGRYALSYGNGAVSVEPTGAAADLCFSALDAVYALCGPAPAALTGFDLPAAVMRLVKSWLPLPLMHFDTERV